MIEEIAFLGVAEGGCRLAAGTLSAREWAEVMLARIAAVDPLIHSTITVTAETARAAADAADAERRQGRIRGPLHGVPIGLKDCIETEGIRTTAHSAWLSGTAKSRFNSSVAHSHTRAIVMACSHSPSAC